MRAKIFFSFLLFVGFGETCFRGMKENVQDEANQTLENVHGMMKDVQDQRWHLIIASGSPYDNATRTETFNWQNEDNYTCDLPDQPNGIGGAVPVLIENIEYICGGGYPSTAHCFNLITADTAPFNLLHKRVGASSVTANDKVFVFGGWNGIERDMASYETISVDNAQSEGVLPFTWSNGCSTLINSTTILLAGGRQHMTIKSEKTWLFNFETEEWTQGPSMIEGRNAFGCGLIKSINSVAAFGGYPSIGRTEIVKTSELVKLPGGIFKKVDDLPLKLYGMSTVQDPTDFSSLVVSGGFDENIYYGQESGAILKLTCTGEIDCKWEVLHHKLQVPRSRHISFFTNRPLNCSTFH